MSTSLQEQLKRLAVPQTSTLYDASRKASILFDAKEAATKDRRTIYELGLTGLQDLIALNISFAQFETTLFDKATVELERAVEQRELNEVLDRNLRKFLQHLSPYFLLRSAHLCLEWLIRRFQIHEYNRSELMALILPYHETNAFVRCLQCIRFRKTEQESEWSWLRPLQKPGLSLPKSVIINRAASDANFLAFVCKHTQQSMQELGHRANLLQTQLNFFASIAVGALENAAPVKEWHVVTLLPVLLDGLKSHIVDFVSAAFIVASQLVARTQLKPKLCNALLLRVANVSFEQLRSPAVLLLIWIFDSQAAANPHFDEATMLTLMQNKWLTSVLATLAKENVAIHSLCCELLSSAVKAIQQAHEETLAFKSFLNRLLDDIVFSDATAQTIISCFLDSFVLPTSDKTSTKSKLSDGDIIELDSDEDMPDANDVFQTWYSDYLSKLERQYPNAFDVVIKDTLSSSMHIPVNRQKAVKIALSFRLKTNDENTSKVFEGLYHHTAKIRLFAVNALFDNLSNYKTKSQNYTVLRECLADRIYDDSELVVAEVLKLQTQHFVEILGYEKFVEALFVILLKTQTHATAWSALTKRVVQHLTSKEIVCNFDTNAILLALMPLLFPSKSGSEERECIVEILKSELVNKLTFLKNLKLEQLEQQQHFSAAEFRKQFLNVLAGAKNTPSAAQLLEAVRTKDGDEHSFKYAAQFAHFLVLITAFLNEKHTATESLSIFEQVNAHAQQFQIKSVQQQEWQLTADRNELQIVPQQLFADFLNTLTRKTQFTADLLQWYAPTEQHKCLLRIIALVADRVFITQQQREQLLWSQTLKAIFDNVFATAQMKLDFLSNFFVYKELKDVELPNYALLRLSIFKIFNAFIKNNSNEVQITAEHVLKICTALSTDCEITRLQALNSLEHIYTDRLLEDSLKQFMALILARSNELSMDHEQFPLVLFTILKPERNRDKILAQKILKQILQFASKDNTLDNAAFIAEVLNMLKHVSDIEILQQLIPLAEAAIQRFSSNADDKVKLLHLDCALIFQLICERYDNRDLGQLLLQDNDESVWQLVEQIFRQHDVFMWMEGRLLPLPAVWLKSCDSRRTYEALGANYKFKLIKLILETTAVAQHDAIFQSANKLLEHCHIDCAPLAVLLQQMHQQQAKKILPAVSKRSNIDQQLNTKSPAWKTGIALLEFLEQKENLFNTEAIIPNLFGLLKLCLDSSHPSAVDYTKQITLSALLHCCQLAQQHGVALQNKLSKTVFRIDQIVQCVRAEQNSQTQQHALLLLTHCAQLYPQQVLHNIVDIFTFVGTTFVRHDDAYSFYIINKIIETIIPILVKQRIDLASESVHSFVIPVLKVFSDILLDVPEHRRVPLYTKLLNTLGAEQHLWQFLCIVFEQHVMQEEKQRLLQRKTVTHTTNDAQLAAEKTNKRLEVAIELSNALAAPIIFETCIQLLNYIRSLPISKQSAEASTSSKSLRRHTLDSNAEVSLFNVEQRTAKQLRHYQYTIMQFLSTITSSKEFLSKVASLNAQDLTAMKPYYQNFILKILSFVPAVSEAIAQSVDTAQIKFWKVILHHVYDLLDNAISLLSPDMFLVVIRELMSHQLLNVRKKVIELLITKLQQWDDFFEKCSDKNVQELLKPLNEIISGITDKTYAPTHHDASTSSNEYSHLQQTALVAVKLLSKLYGLKFIEDFKALQRKLSKTINKRANISKTVLATVILTLIEVSSNLKAHSLALLPKYMPQLLDILKDQANLAQTNVPDQICLALVTGFQKLIESLPLFLGPYIVDIIVLLSNIKVRIAAQQNEKDQRSAAVLHKIGSIWSKTAVEMPVRILLPSAQKIYRKLVSAEQFMEISELMSLLLASIKHNNSSDLTQLQAELSSFFLQVLEFRVEVQASQLSNENIALIEGNITDTFVAWILKLSESSFRPLYHKLCDWAFKTNKTNASALTFFVLTNKTAEALKSLFVLFIGDFIEDAVRLLDQCNTAKNQIAADEEHVYLHLLKAILSTFQIVFSYDNKRSLSSLRFEMLLQPIVDQLENRLLLENTDVEASLSACISQLAVAVSTDVLWKQLNYQVLLKTRTNVPEVRIIAFKCCVEIARKLGEEFSSLLPETIPFIAELFEDENSRVEKSTRKAVQELEIILGESLQKYL